MVWKSPSLAGLGGGGGGFLTTATGFGLTTATGFALTTATGFGLTSATGFGLIAGFGFSTLTGFGFSTFGALGTGAGLVLGVDVAVVVVDSYWGISDFSNDRSDFVELETVDVGLDSFATGVFAFDTAGFGDSPSSLASKSSTAFNWCKRPKVDERYCNGAKAATDETCTATKRKTLRLNIMVIKKYYCLISLKPTW